MKRQKLIASLQVLWKKEGLSIRVFVRYLVVVLGGMLLGTAVFYLLKKIGY